jgi:hypothetical protein
LAKEAYRHLSRYLKIVGRKESSEPVGYSPIEIMGHATCFLITAATISKILHPSDNSAKARDRGARLRARLGDLDLPHIHGRAVRNHYEHVDERLDALSERTVGNEVRLIDISSDVQDGTVNLKRLNPAAGTIEFLGESISIEGCIEDIRKVEAEL